jgi:hypothetical protein
MNGMVYLNLDLFWPNAETWPGFMQDYNVTITGKDGFSTTMTIGPKNTVVYAPVYRLGGGTYYPKIARVDVSIPRSQRSNIRTFNKSFTKMVTFATTIHTASTNHEQYTAPAIACKLINGAITHTANTVEGMCGAPMLVRMQGQNYLVGMHAMGSKDPRYKNIAVGLLNAFEKQEDKFANKFRDVLRNLTLDKDAVLTDEAAAIEFNTYDKELGVFDLDAYLQMMHESGNARGAEC